MSRPRHERALGDPPEELSGFPRWRLRPDFALRRAHGAGAAPWWFSSNLSGRFDLVAPFGTCYLATDVTSALRERFGHDLVEQGVVTFKAAAQTQVSTLHSPAGRWLADGCHDDAAAFGVTRELGTCAGYDLPQGWAGAFHRARFAGLRYQTRFSTGTRPESCASAGSQTGSHHRSTGVAAGTFDDHHDRGITPHIMTFSHKAPWARL